MEILKVGVAEEKLIKGIEEFKATYQKRIEYISFGISMIKKQVPNNTKGELKAFGEMIDVVDELVHCLGTTIQKIAFSGIHDETKFKVSWFEYDEKREQFYLRSVGGATEKNEATTEVQFVYAILSWEREVCKRLAKIRELEPSTYNNFCYDAEMQLRGIINEYANPAPKK